jgi:hypothetical protein
MALHRPKVHYWNLVEAIYNWQAMDLYETAAVCVRGDGGGREDSQVQTRPQNLNRSRHKRKATSRLAEGVGNGFP